MGNISCQHIFLICDSCFSNSLLLSATPKSTNDYFKHSSRWALTSSYTEAMDSDEQSNTLFAETIIKYLENADRDVRVSELIEDVKRMFLDNRMQQPQGYPLLISGHKGGEYVFEIKQEVDNRRLKGYNDFKKTLQLYKRTSLFQEMSSFEDKSRKIGFQLFSDIDKVIKKATYYLYLYEGINQTQTLRYLQENFSQIFKDKNLIVFIPREKNILNLELRKKNISDKFKPINLFFIDDFIREYCTPKITQDETYKFLNISNFVLPILNNYNRSESIDQYLINWFEKDNEPILILKGTGGIGKTTFSQYIADNAQTKYPSTSILFIDSLLIKDILLKSKNDGSFKIYNFYEALFDITDSLSEKLSEDVFRINVDVGNILLIIDGLDEIISKIPNFDVQEFLKSISESSNALGGGKVIITCRTHFWNSGEFGEDNFAVIELEPFNNEQAKLFFERSFQTDQSKIRKALKLANEFRYPNSENQHIYDPYVLDIIRSIINSSIESIQIDLSLFTSKLLNSNFKNDYIIYRVCDRERKRIGQIDVDDQVLFFTYLAVEKRGIIRGDFFTSEITQALGKHVDITNLEAFKSHPFLKFNDSTITFRYDFLGDLFRGMFVSTYFDHAKDRTELTQYFLDAIIENCWYGSAITQDIVNRSTHWNDDDLFLAYGHIDQIMRKNDILSIKKRKAIANIFSISLMLNEHYLGADIFKNTELLKKLFSTNGNTIEDISIINVNSDQNIRFDFSGLTIVKAFIDNYTQFWECGFNTETRFIKCHLINLSLFKKDVNVSKTQFIDCIYDNEVEVSLKRIELKDAGKLEQAKAFMNDFFHLFFSNGRLGRQWEQKIIRPRFTGINKYNYDYKKIIKILKHHNILIATDEKEGVKFSIYEEHKEDVIRFIKDGTISDVIGNIVRDLSS